MAVGFVCEFAVWNIKTLSLEKKISGTKQRCPLLPLLLNTVMEVPATVIRQGDEIKGNQIGKETVKLPLFTNNMILYIDFSEKLLDLINEVSNVAAYKINTQKSMAFYALIMNYQKE